MADWLTALGGAGAAYIGGVLTKPLQNWIEERRERRRLRKALYVEMSKILSHCHYVIGELRRDASISNYWDVYLKGLWPSHCFETVRANPINLNLLPDIKGINHFFKGLEALANAHQIMQKENRSMFFFSVLFFKSVLGILRIIEDGELSKNELIRSGDSNTAALLQGVPDLGAMIPTSEPNNRTSECAKVFIGLFCVITVYASNTCPQLTEAACSLDYLKINNAARR